MTAGDINRIQCYPPGSPFARKHGCECPRMDNCNGAGRYGNGDKYGWFTSQGCKLHGWEADDKKRETELSE
jgi:hypothetical protein